MKPSDMPAHPPVQPEPKKPYVRPEHLTHRPFRDPNLAKMRGQVSRKTQPNFKIRKK